MTVDDSARDPFGPNLWDEFFHGSRVACTVSGSACGARPLDDA